MTPETLLPAVCELAPHLKWDAERASLALGATAEVRTHLPDGRWISVCLHDRAPEFRVDVTRVVREQPLEEDETSLYGDVTHFSAGRTWDGADLAALLASALADELLPQDMLGLRLFPHRPAFGGQGWLDESGRYEFSPGFKDRWDWRLHGRIPKMLRSLFSSSGEIGGSEPTLPEAVAAARAAPSRIGALLAAMEEEYGPPPALPQWIYAGQAVARGGERVVVGPMNDLRTLKAALREAEKPLFGSMDTDNSFVAAVRNGHGLNAEAVLAHPQARRLKRY